MSDAPDRIYRDPDMSQCRDKRSFLEDVEYIRADLVQQKVDMLRGALAAVVAWSDDTTNAGRSVKRIAEQALQTKEGS